MSHGHSSGGRLLLAGLIVVGLLAFLTGIEFYIAKHMESNLAPLFASAIVKALLILWYFMHLARSWANREAA